MMGWIMNLGFAGGRKAARIRIKGYVQTTLTIKGFVQ
jgi:hypothetical protein